MINMVGQKVLALISDAQVKVNVFSRQLGEIYGETLKHFIKYNGMDLSDGEIKIISSKYLKEELVVSLNYSFERIIILLAS
ncbi:MAG: hypothetical protein K9K76_11180 [Halanaerobiales bacterium]|nr:hypothetical protein [Halanaerobiales bacterium]